MKFEFEFEGVVVEWRGPAPFYFVPLPADLSAEVKALAATLSYGWGVVPVHARVGEVEFTTSLFPREGGFWLPLKLAVTKPNNIKVGDTLEVWLALGTR